MADLADTVLQKYPQFAFMLQDPELRYLLFANLDPQGTFDSTKFQAELMTTNWWKTHSASQRDWMKTVGMDPASAEQQMGQKMTQIRALVASSGLPLSEAQIRWESSLALQNNWDDMQLRQNLHMVAFSSAGATPTSVTQAGAIGTAAQSIRAMAADYLLPMSDETAGNWAMEVWDGTKSLDDLKGTLAHSSAFTWGGKNPELVDAMNRGITPRQFIDPQIQAVAKELEMSTDQINPLDPKWNGILNYQDPNNPKTPPRMMTVPEAQTFARSQQAYRTTDGARQAAYDTALQLGQLMGKTA